MFSYAASGEGGVTSWGAFSLSQQGGYANARYALGTVTYRGDGETVETTLTGEAQSYTATGTLSGQFGGSNADYLHGAHTYTLAGSKGWSQEATKTRNWQSIQDGNTGGSCQPVLTNIELIGHLQETFTYTEASLDTYSGPGYSRIAAATLTSAGNAVGDLDQRGTLDGALWTVSDYRFISSGSSVETYSASDATAAQDAGYDAAGAYHHYVAASSSTDAELRNRSFCLEEEGAKAALGSFVFSAYTKETRRTPAGWPRSATASASRNRPATSTRPTTRKAPSAGRSSRPCPAVGSSIPRAHRQKRRTPPARG